MDILVVGGGGREHAITWKLRQSAKAGKIYCAPGNAGTEDIENCENVNIAANDIDALLSFAVANNIDFTVVGPEEPLSLGIADVFNAAGLKIFAPTKAGARLETSKAYAKSLMKKYNIPTAAYGTFDSYNAAVSYLEELGEDMPVVVKADGLAVGKGVVVCANKTEAIAACHDMLIAGKFGVSGNTIVIEEYLEGEEVSVLAFCDGSTLAPMLPAKDHKRIFDGDKGGNTGGMGAIAPLDSYTEKIRKECEKNIFEPTVKALIDQGIEFKGVIFFGLMMTKNGVKVIEFNARLGDPETQVVLPLLESDLLEIMLACSEGRLATTNAVFSDKYAACVVLASGGYPNTYKKGEIISGAEKQRPNTKIFSFGTKRENGQLVTNGGRVLGVTAVADTLDKALDTAYLGVKDIHFQGLHYRTDIGRTNTNLI